MESLMVVGCSVFLWMLALVAAARLAWIVVRAPGFNSALSLAWCAVAVAAACLLFRPHEDIFGGEDPGSYVNSGITYGRKLALFHEDPLLAQVRRDLRPLFYYGHSGYGATKDACLWVRDAKNAVIGPHFQPAYPLLISMASRLGGPFAGLYVVPLFTLFAALAIAALARQCLPNRWSGISAFFLYLMNPLVLWHGRCARPEIIASFFFFAGAALLLNAWNRNQPSGRPDILLGALCVGFAPFFHITAWLLVVPTTFVVLCAILQGRKDFLLCPLAAIVPATAFLCQLAYITDYYDLLRFLSFFLRRPATSLACLAGVFAILASARLAARRFSSAGSNTTRPENVSIPLAASLACATTAFIAVSYFTRDAAGSLPILGRPVENYLYLTDLRALANMVSLPMAVLALIGWITWLIGPTQGRAARAVVALAVFPAIMLAGRINDFMMTRYLLVSVVPVSALCLASLASLAPDRPRFAPLSAALALAMGLAGLHGRTHLLAITEHKGLARFLEPFAREIIENNGILLCEYSRLAAPFEHFFGIPTLGLDNEQKNDYSRQEKAWETIMKNCTARPAFFITPFQRPASGRFDFALLRSSVFEDQSLQPAYNNLPTRLNRGPLPLSMYRMTIRSPEGGTPETSAPAVIAMDAGNMGLRRFANIRVRARPIRGVEWHASEPISLDMSACTNFLRASEMLFLLMTDEPYPHAPIVLRENGELIECARQDEQCFFRIADEWWIFRIRQDAVAEQGPFSVKTDATMFLADAFMITDNDAISIMGRFPQERMVERMTRPFMARWTRCSAEALVQTPPGGKGTILILLEAPDTGNGLPTDFSISSSPHLPRVSRSVETSRWQWQAWPLRLTDFERDSLWLELHTSPAWDSSLHGFPPDLGVLVGYIVVLPP